MICIKINIKQCIIKYENFNTIEDYHYKCFNIKSIVLNLIVFLIVFINNEIFLIHNLIHIIIYL